MKSKALFLTDIFIVFLFGLIQSFSLISFYGIKPNLLLSLLTVLMFSVKDFWQYLILVLTGLIALKYSNLISSELLAFGAIMFLAFYFKKYFTEHEFLAIFCITAILSIVFYALTDYGYIVNNFGSFALEIIYNVLASIIFWLILDTTTIYNTSLQK
jgi:hypothetical protein